MNTPPVKLFVLLFLVAMLLQSCGLLPKPDICDERTGRAAIAAQNYDVAYEHLKGCEKLENVSGEALAQLALLTEIGYGTFESDKARHTKYFEFMHRAALKLEPNAISSLISFYKNGDKIVPQEPRVNIAECLMKLLDSGQGNRRQVLICLSL
ncbi:MAG: hypothetical protein V3U65_11355 [Granulosicoccaceae bacterium]